MRRCIPQLHGRLTLWVFLSLHGAAVALPDDAASNALAPPAAEVPADALTQLLVERGLLPAGAPAVVQGMRDRASDMVLSAMHFLGVPYKRGGSSADEGFDCSGFTRHVFEMSLGLVLPRRVDDQATAAGLMAIDKSELKPGDLVFFNTLRRTFSHVGIYVGDGKFIHAPRTGASVRVEDMRYAYWAQRYTGARRAAIGPDTPAANLVMPERR